jgi:hypothetical protein
MTSRHVRAGARVQNNGHSNVRHSTNGLDTDQVKELNSAWHHAATIGLPLNSFVSVRPIDIDDMSPAERCRRFAVIRNKLGVYDRLRGFEPTSIWSREVNPDGTGEHLHVIAHIPRKHLSDFEKTVLGWFPGVREADGGDHLEWAIIFRLACWDGPDGIVL